VVRSNLTETARKFRTQHTFYVAATTQEGPAGHDPPHSRHVAVRHDAESALVQSYVTDQSISTNGSNRPTQRPRVRNVWCCHWLSKRRAKTKQITSQAWARLDISGGGPLLWHASIPIDARQRISMNARSSRNCLQATGHAFHWLSWFEQGTRGWPNDPGRLQTGLFAVAQPFKLQKKGDPARPPRDALTDQKM